MDWDRWERSRVTVRTPCDSAATPPENRAGLIEAAELIAGSIDHLRVDIYEIDGSLYFGEATVYPNSGHVPWIRHDAICDPDPPLDVDREFASHWVLPAISRRTMLRRGLIG